MKKLFLLLLIFLAIPCLVMADEVVRTWKSQSGEVILEAAWDAQNDTGGEKVALKTAEGKQHNIPLKNLSDADQKYVTDGRAKKNSHSTDEDFGLKEVSETPKKMEKLLGVEPGSKAGERMVKTVNGVEYAFRWCPAGTFMMGSPEGELGRRSNEKQHSVTLSQGFWMLETEVTQGMWESVMEESIQQKAKQGSYGQDLRGEGRNYPMYYVSWDDCQTFCRKLSSQGLNVQLPTEAQWEYACRAGTTEALNNGKNLTSETGTCPNLGEVGWYRENSDRTTHVVGQKRPNNWGLYDMHGNVWEWCSDWGGDYPSSGVTDPEVRGGSWGHVARYCRGAGRNNSSPERRIIYLGFRVSIISDK